MVIKAPKILVIMSVVGFLTLIQLSDSYASISRDEKKQIKQIDEQYQLFSSNPLQGDLFLEELLLESALRNENLKAAFYRWKAAFHAIKKEKSLDDPELSFKTYLQEVETRVGPQKQMYGVAQKIPFPGKLYTKGEAAKDVARQEYAAFLKAELDLVYQVKEVFYEYWYLQKAIRVTEENEALLRHFEEVAQSKFKSSLSSNQDLLKAQVELGKLANDLLTLDEYRKPVVSRINALLNQPPATTISWPSEINHKIIELDKEKLMDRFYENNPDLKMASERMNEAQKRIRLARMDFIPDVMVGFDYISIDERSVAVAGNGDDAMALNFKMNVPLWFGKQKSQLDESKAKRNFVIAKKAQTQRDLESQLEMVFFKLQDAQRQINLYKNALLPKAEQSLKASETGYTAGKIDFLNLIDSERMLLNFQLSYYRSIRDYEQRLAELEMIIGETIRR